MLRRRPCTRRCAFSHLILATGATDRVLPFPGWTTARRLHPRRCAGRAEVAGLRHRRAGGVSRLRAAALPRRLAIRESRRQGCGRARHGAASRPSSSPARLCAQPGVVAARHALCGGARGARRAGALRRRTGSHRGRRRASTGIVWQRARRGDTTRLRRGGLRPRPALGDPARGSCRLPLRLRRDGIGRGVPERDARGAHQRAAASISPATAPALPAPTPPNSAGERAGLALLEDAGLSVDASRGSACSERKLAAIGRFRRRSRSRLPVSGGLGRAALPTTWSLCRCEEIAVGEARAAARDQGVLESIA